MNQYHLSDKDFFAAYSKVPRLDVDLVIASADGILLALRNIEPSRGFWHLPGGTVYKGEKIADAAVRIAEKETGLATTFDKELGYMEFLGEVRSGVNIHTVSIVIAVVPTGNNLKHDENAKELRYFKEMPEKIIIEHGAFIKSHGLL